MKYLVYMLHTNDTLYIKAKSSVSNTTITVEQLNLIFKSY